MEIKYTFTEPNHKHFFAGLFNTAQNNFDLSLLELESRINTKQNNNLSKIDFAFNNSRPLYEFENNFKYLSESLVFLNRIKSFVEHKNKKDNTKIIFRDFVKDFLKDLYALVNNLRNYYSHFSHPEIEVKPIIIEFINYILFNSTNRVKDDKAKKEDVKNRLSRQDKYLADFNVIFKNQNVKNNANGKKLIKPQDKINFTINKLFHYFIDDSTNNPVLTDAVISEKALSNAGYIQLLALFLNKRQINLLFDNVVYSKSENDLELQKIIVRWVYTNESYKSIKKLFKSEYQNDSLLLQMVSELSKCPNELYNQLNDTDKNEFIEDINIFLKENENIPYEDALVEHEVIKKRYEDKFPYFAIRFLDEFANFPNLRFHVNMGKFNHNTETKTINGLNVTTERKILEKLTVFEKLSIATQKKNNYFIKIEEEKKNKNENNIDDKTAKEWVEYPRPKYQFFNNNIGIWLNDKKLGESNAVKLRDKQKLTKYDILKKIDLADNLKKPVAYLSFNELPALLYNLLVIGNSPEEIENQLKNKITEQKIFVSKLTDKTESEKKFPYKLKKTLDENIVDFDWKKLLNQIDIEINKDPLAEIRNNYKKIPKNPEVLSTSEKGKLATWLSKDIKNFVKKEKKENWKGYQFAEFQALLAFYDLRKQDVKGLINEDLKFDYFNDFPFKGFDFSKKSLFEFYSTYKQKRKGYLLNVMNLIKKEQYSEQLKELFHKKKYVVKTMDEYKKTTQTHPFMLQRGIFDKNPTSAPNNSISNKAAWFTESMNLKNAQEFYNYPKNYDSNIKDAPKIKITQNSGIKDQINKGIDKILKDEIYKNEGALRKTMRNDFFVLEMIKHIFKSENQINNTTLKAITLKDFYLTKKEKLAYEKNVEQQNTRAKGDTSEFLFNESYILSKRTTLKLLDGKIEGTVAFKDINKYKKLSQDERIQQLVAYDTSKTWSFANIINEISNYEHIRSHIFFKQVHTLEKGIYKKAKDKNKLNLLLEKDAPSFKKYINYHYHSNTTANTDFENMNIQNNDINNVDDKFKKVFLIVQIRNKFAHNQLVPLSSFRYLNTIIPIEENEKIANYLNRSFTFLIKNTTEINEE